ncbi:hypothetical protein NHX12_015564 [Muraenolepis orangiensis]|uniref:NACHT domain-containing protein n=1 Tax=Muraenolepis orangiensis TaxID=630683 RepID=A0A9Q0DA00_9TELE|nr:hypothetical protein NHX12_015564 [Muraenolepis orangiensis]
MQKFRRVFEGIAKAGQQTSLNDFYTELFITERVCGEVNKEHEVRLIETASRKQAKEETPIKSEDIFKPLPGQDQPSRTIMTTGVAGIGKTVLTNKFTLDWAEGKANHDIHFTLPFTFRELNLLKEKEFSFVELLHHFFIQTKGICRYDLYQVVFILDGLDECRLPLDFQNNPIWTDVTKSTSVDVLLTNLIRGDLLPSARIWITTRPAAANRIPAECVGMVTEVRGFTNPQKEEYFMKRFREETLASTIISHIKSSRSLHIMRPFIMATYNANTVREEARLEELENCVEERGVEILGVQEHRRVHTDQPILYHKVGGCSFITSSAWRNDAQAATGGVGLMYTTLQNTTLQNTTPQYTTLQNTTPQYTTPQNTTLQNTTPQNTTLQYTTHQNTTHQYTTPQNTTPQYTTPQNTTTQNTTPQYTTPQYTTHQYTTPQNTTPQYTTHQYTTLQNTTLQNTTPQYTTLQNTTPQYTTPQNTTLQNTTPQNTTLQYTTPQNTTPQYTTPQNTTTQNTTPQYTTHQYTTPQNTTPQYTTPQYTTHQYTTPQNTTPQYTTHQYTTLQNTTLQNTILAVPLHVVFTFPQTRYKVVSSKWTRGPGLSSKWTRGPGDQV